MSPIWKNLNQESPNTEIYPPTPATHLSANSKSTHLTHGGREDDDPQDVHALAGTGHDLVIDVRRWSDVQKDRVAQAGIVIVGHDVDVVGL